MDYNEAKRLGAIQTRIKALQGKLGSYDVRPNADGIQINKGCWSVLWESADTVRLSASGYRLSDTPPNFPEGVEYHKENVKHYLLFKDGTGKDVNYLIPEEGLQLLQVARERYKPLNPIQDYVIELNEDKLKAEKAEAEEMKKFVRTMWPMVQCPDDFKATKGTAQPHINDRESWLGFVLTHRFFFETDRYGINRWYKRDKENCYNIPERSCTPCKSFVKPIALINEHFNIYHTAYDVKVKSPYTPPHWSPEWSQLERLRKEGLVP